MQGIKGNYSVDALKVCYRTNQLMYNKLTSNNVVEREYVFKSPNVEDLDTEDFRLLRIRDSKFDFQILVPDDYVGFSLFGTLTLKSNDDPNFSGKCFIDVDNKRLYEPFVRYNKVLSWKKNDDCVDVKDLEHMSDYVKLENNNRLPAETATIQYNSVFFLSEISSRLGLELVSISNLEIAFDCNVNFARLIKRTIADEKYIPVINRKEYVDVKSRESIDNAFVSYSTTRSRVKNLTYYITQSKKKLQLKCYDKSNEISKSNKTYIKTWLNMDKNIHRMEITAKSEPISAFCESINITLEEFLENIHVGKYLSTAFASWLNRLIHFKYISNPNGTKISIFELVGKNKK